MLQEVEGEEEVHHLRDVTETCVFDPFCNFSTYARVLTGKQIVMLLCAVAGATSFIFTKAKIQSVTPVHSHWQPSVDPLRDIQAFCLI